MSHKLDPVIEAEGIKELLNSSFYLYLNANDFFQAACADMVVFSPYDTHWAAPIAAKYKQDGVNAIMSYIRKQQPLGPYHTAAFKAAYDELVALNPVVDSED
jgi:hypothetical protein